MHGLPLQLSSEEVTLILDEKWGVALGIAGAPELVGQGAGCGVGEKKKRKWAGAYAYDDEDDDGYYSSDQDDGYQYGNDDEEDEGEAEDDGAKKKPLVWQEALARGGHYDVPNTVEEARIAQSLRVGVDVEDHLERMRQKDAEVAATATPVEWTFPATSDERNRYIVFRDLHRRGFRITAGSKFGSDFLLYPGDPTLYHAQFCVRLMSFTTPLLPAMLASACRGSFQARKHLLVASVVEETEEGDNERGRGRSGGGAKVQYMTFGPVDGFG